uniref:Uncharacterized protein n=1 Tax=Mesocestoides corti TaxID=53468 RepID=A0A5K3FUM9_MESCO
MLTPLLILGSCLFIFCQTAVHGLPQRGATYGDGLEGWSAEGDVRGFSRHARIPTDFSFNSDLALLRKMISESRLNGHKLLAFGKSFALLPVLNTRSKNTINVNSALCDANTNAHFAHARSLRSTPLAAFMRPESVAATSKLLRGEGVPSTWLRSE